MSIASVVALLAGVSRFTPPGPGAGPWMDLVFLVAAAVMIVSLLWIAGGAAGRDFSEELERVDRLSEREEGRRPSDADACADGSAVEGRQDGLREEAEWRPPH